MWALYGVIYSKATTEAVFAIMMTLSKSVPASQLLAGTHNSKMGRLIHSFSIPAIKTCPGRSSRCARLCYADRGFFMMPNVVSAHAQSYSASLKKSFPGLMRRAIDRTYARVVRIHVAGDFYSREYAEKWLDIVQSRPRVVFFAYTRSWRKPAILPALKALAKLENFHLWFSEDRETGHSPHVEGVRVAYLVADALDEGVASDHADLIFRESAVVAAVPERVKRIKNILVCPHEQGGDTATKFTCSSCQICFRPRASRRDLQQQ